MRRIKKYAVVAAGSVAFALALYLLAALPGVIEALEHAVPAIGDAFGDDDTYTLLARAALGMLCDVYDSHTTQADREAHTTFWMKIIHDALEGARTHVNRSIEIAEGDHDPPEDTTR